MRGEDGETLCDAAADVVGGDVDTLQSPVGEQRLENGDPWPEMDVSMDESYGRSERLYLSRSYT